MARFTHDCTRCTYLGIHAEYDLYFCEGIFPTVLARYGNEGPEYQSFGVDVNALDMFEKKPDHPLAVAWREALPLNTPSIRKAVHRHKRHKQKQAVLHRMFPKLYPQPITN